MCREITYALSRGNGMYREITYALSRGYRVHRQFPPVIGQDGRVREIEIIYAGSTGSVVKYRM
jgi:hypothetical protein